MLVFLVDDMGYGHINANFEKYILKNLNKNIVNRDKDVYELDMALEATVSSMPTVKKLIKQGVRMTNAHVAHSLCAPSRSAILTGRYPQTFGIYNNQDMNNHGVPDNIKMLPLFFQENGYATGMFGKWHVAKYDEGQTGSSPKGQHPNDRGFDYYFGFNKSGTEYYNSKLLFRNRERVKAREYLTDQLTDEAAAYIKRIKDKPVFIYLAYNAPHGPLTRYAPKEYDAKFEKLPRKLRIWNSYMYAVDQGIKKILDALKEKGGLENTLVFFLSDNGASGNTPLPANGYNRGFKGTLFQGGTRTAMCAWWPGKIPANTVCKELICSFDILPTALAAANILIPEQLNIDGKNILPLITGKRKKNVHDYLVWANRNALSWSYPRNKWRNVPAAWSMRQGKWMLHYWAETDSFTLYDVEKDIGEKKDLSKKYPEIIKTLEKKYAEWYRRIKKPLNWEKNIWLGLKPTDQRTPEEKKIIAETIKSLILKKNVWIIKISRGGGDMRSSKFYKITTIFFVIVFILGGVFSVDLLAEKKEKKSKGKANLIPSIYTNILTDEQKSKAEGFETSKKVKELLNKLKWIKDKNSPEAKKVKDSLKKVRIDQWFEIYDLLSKEQKDKLKIEREKRQDKSKGDLDPEAL